MVILRETKLLGGGFEKGSAGLQLGVERGAGSSFRVANRGLCRRVYGRELSHDPETFHPSGATGRNPPVIDHSGVGGAFEV